MGVLRSNSLDHTRVTMAELGLKKKEIEAINFAFDVYDFKGDGKVDAFYAGDVIRACNLNPTLKTIAEIGGTTEKGQKMLTKDDVFPMYKACKDSKDQGGFHDFVEILKLYDKNDDNTMLAHELFRLLTNLGEKLTKEEAKSPMKASCPSFPSWRECVLLRSKFSSQVQQFAFTIWSCLARPRLNSTPTIFSASHCAVSVLGGGEMSWNIPEYRTS